MQEAFIPPHVELQALVAAAIGNFGANSRVAEPGTASDDLGWRRIYQRAQTALTAYQRQEMPAAVWYREEIMLRPGINTSLLFREYPEYPTPVPYLSSKLHHRSDPECMNSNF